MARGSFVSQYSRVYCDRQGWQAPHAMSPKKDVTYEQQTGFDKKIKVNIGGLSNSLIH